MEEREREILQQLKNDFPHYAAKCLKVKSKDVVKGSAVVPLVLNPAQKILHEAVEKQLHERGFVRAIVVKGRQQGCSTYIQGRMFWKTTFTKGLRGYILSHKDDSTQTLFAMAKMFYDNCPEVVRPQRDKSNAKELTFGRLGSGYKVDTAGGRGAGRSDTIHYLHLSECAYYPNAEETVAGISQSVPEAPGTEVFLESTSSGPSGLFYERAMAAKEGRSDYILIFIPWFVSPEYASHPRVDFIRDDEEVSYAEKHDAECTRLTGKPLSDAQLLWRRNKILELNGAHNFRREYPATIEEAFKADAKGALWTTARIEETRVKEHPDLVRIVVAVDPSGSNASRADEQGIVAAGIADNGHVYVLADGSGKYTPDGWARRAINLFRELSADRIVGEQNFGGQMVEQTIRSVDANASYVGVQATRGKVIRAEPIAALYEQGKVHHVGCFPALEDELVTWDPIRSRRSPNRLDALVWALTELAVKNAAKLHVKSFEI